MTTEELTQLKKDALYERHEATTDYNANCQRLAALARKFSELRDLTHNPANYAAVRSSLSVPTTDDVHTAIQECGDASQRLDEAKKECARLGIE